ncbi:hypothetical protein SGM_6161 [Streptomyces griseoaurantiacus M045]|uniref:Uncharacterized protein n=1 Tax=Streptomyces griseoaurantiacus M045 TaxID=996637 RepID=F3NSP7_9ACTN|nr:hypothetical protein SGM_6161 [Streptomyces griseoaurantiacus M045]
MPGPPGGLAARGGANPGEARWGPCSDRSGAAGRPRTHPPPGRPDPSDRP